MFAFTGHAVLAVDETVSDAELMALECGTHSRSVTTRCGFVPIGSVQVWRPHRHAE